jgi:Tol biopolymer transport system component
MNAITDFPESSSEKTILSLVARIGAKRIGSIHHALRTCLLAMFALAAAGCTGRTSTSVAPASSAQEQIVFASERDGNSREIYVMNLDQTGLRQLTDDPAEDGGPVWSPDGALIAFASDRDGDFDIYVMSADGSAVTRLTDAPAGDGFPAWSPDGTQIAFASDRDGNFEIYVMSAGGTGVQRLTNESSNDFSPVWSPDGTQIAFDKDRDGINFDIYLMNADGTGVEQLTDVPGGDFSPAWSPDGRTIAFFSDRHGNADIYVMNADGTGVRQLTDNPAADVLPAWSRDGTKIVFVSEREGNPDIYMMNPDATGIERLTDDPAEDLDPDWSSGSGAFLQNQSLDLTLAPANDGAGKVGQWQVVAGLLLPAHQQPAEAVQPCVGNFTNPPARFSTPRLALPLFCIGFVRNMNLIPVRLRHFRAGRITTGLVHRRVLGVACGSGRSTGRLASVASSNFLSGVLAPLTTMPKATPRSSTKRLRFVPRFARSVRFGAVFPPLSGALVITPSAACHFHAMPFNPSYCPRPALHMRRNTPARTQR